MDEWMDFPCCLMLQMLAHTEAFTNTNGTYKGNKQYWSPFLMVQLISEYQSYILRRLFLEDNPVLPSKRLRCNSTLLNLWSTCLLFHAALFTCHLRTPATPSPTTLLKHGKTTLCCPTTGCNIGAFQPYLLKSEAKEQYWYGKYRIGPVGQLRRKPWKSESTFLKLSSEYYSFKVKILSYVVDYEGN